MKLYSMPEMMDWRGVFSLDKEAPTTRTHRVRKEKLTQNGGKTTAKMAFRGVEYSF